MAHQDYSVPALPRRIPLTKEEQAALGAELTLATQPRVNMRAIRDEVLAGEDLVTALRIDHHGGVFLSAGDRELLERIERKLNCVLTVVGRITGDSDD